MDYCIVVRVEKDMFLDPKVSSDISCKNYRKELLAGNRLQLLRQNPEASKLVIFHVHAIAKQPFSIRRYFNISLRLQSWEEPEANPPKTGATLEDPDEILNGDEWGDLSSKSSITSQSYGVRKSFLVTPLWQHDASDQ